MVHRPVVLFKHIIYHIKPKPISVGWIRNRKNIGDSRFELTNETQWRNRRWGGGGRGRVHPQRLLTGEILLTYREKGGKEKRKRREN